MREPLRVLVAAPGSMLGGQAHAAAAIVAGFAGDPALDVRLQPIDPRLEGVARPLTEWAGVRSLVRPLLYYRALRRGLEHTDICHVFCAAHTAFFFGAVPAVVAAGRARVPVVLNYHDGRAESHLRWWGPVLRWAIRRSAALVFPSPYLQRIFAERGFAGTIVPNVVDTGAFQYRRPEPVRARMVSARLLEPLYAVDNTIRAFALVRGAMPDATLDVYGSGSSLPSLRRVAREVGGVGVTFHGAVPHAAMPAAFAGGGVLVNSSRVDNAPHVLIEAWAAGLPVVSTGAGGIPDIVEDGHTGLLVPLDDPQALADATLRVLREPGLGVRLADAGREACVDYSWRRAGEGWRSVYSAVAASSSDRVGAAGS